MNRESEYHDAAATVTTEDGEENRPKPQASEYLSNQILGFCFLGLSVILLLLLLYLTVYVVAPMTRPSSFFEELTKAYSSQLVPKDGQEAAKSVDELTVNLVVMLEYASADIRTTGVQIAFALLAGFFLVVVGVVLFAAGATGAFRFQGTAPGARLDLAGAAPGLLCVVLGAAIIMIGVGKDTERKLDSYVNRPVGFHTESQEVAAGAKFEGVPKDITDKEYPPSANPPGTPESAPPAP